MASSAKTSSDTEYCFMDPAQMYADGLYTVQSDLWSTHMKFPMPGRESSNALRDYLRKWGGFRIPVDNISLDHLLELQAVFWRETSSTIFATNLDAKITCVAEIGHRWKDVRALSAEVRTITDLLENGDHVFIVYEKSNKVCNNPVCPRKAVAVEDMASRPQKITLEPLFDWGTVTPASNMYIAKGKIFPFQRNGVKMDDRLWYKEVKKMVGARTLLPTYCVECLEEAMARRAEAWGIAEQRAWKTCRGQLPIGRPKSEEEMYDRRESAKAANIGWGGVGGHQLDDQDDLYEQSVPDQASNIPQSPRSGHVSGLQLDGTGKSPSGKRQKPYCFGNEDIHVPVKYPAKAKVTKTLPTHRASDGSFTPQLSPKSLHNVATPRSTCAPVDESPLTPATSSTARASISSTSSSNRTSVYRDHRSPEDYPKLGSEALLESSSPDLGTGHREFGRDIETNIIRTIFHKIVSRRVEMAKAKENKPGLDIRNFFTAVNRPSSVTTTAEAGPSTPRRAVKTKKLDSEGNELCELPSGRETDKEDLEASGAEHYTGMGKVKGKAVSPKTKASPKKSSPSTPTKKDKFGPPYTPIHRKRDPSSPSEKVPNGVVEEAWDAHLDRVPEKQDIICSCHKPAQTYDVQITQCANKDCRIRWFHKDCLDKSGKLKAKHGTYTCDQCRAEEYYAKLRMANVWNTNKLVREELKMPYTGEQLASALPNMGGFAASPNPYGLASSALISTTLSPVALEFKPRRTYSAVLAATAVGSAPSLGFATSRPYCVDQAYTNAAAHAEYADEQWEYAQQYGYYDVGSDG